MTLGTKPDCIALLFEYATLNGGERSMLACLDWWLAHKLSLEFRAIAPPDGRLAECLRARGVEVVPWITTGPDGIKLPRDELVDRLQRIVLELDPDLLHANSLSMGRFTGAVAGRLPIPTTAHLRDIINVSQSALDDLNRNRLLMAVSHATRDAHVTRGLDATRVVVVHNGLDLTRFRPRPKSGWLHRELRLPSDARLIATVGQIGLRKGQNILAQAAPIIVSQQSETHFLIVGERSSQKEESVLFEQGIAQRFEEHGLKNRLHFLGYRDDIPGLLAEVDLLVHPANQEPFGRVLLEASACGVPVIATDVGGTSEIIADRVTGRLIPPRDAEALAAVVIELLSKDELRQTFGNAAHQRAQQMFGVERCARRTLDYWLELLG